MIVSGTTTQRWLATTAILVAIVAGLWFNQARGLKAVATETHTALCALKADLEHRHEAGLQYLVEHPQGVVTRSGDVVISAALLRQSLDAQQATLDALSALTCP